MKKLLPVLAVLALMVVLFLFLTIESKATCSGPCACPFGATVQSTVLDSTVYGSLRLWQDFNHNGISEAAELQALTSFAVEALELRYKLSKRVDEYGNEFRYRAKVRGGTAGRWAWDVFLLG
jgi:hypothetical protein